MGMGCMGDLALMILVRHCELEIVGRQSPKHQESQGLHAGIVVEETHHQLHQETHALRTLGSWCQCGDVNVGL